MDKRVISNDILFAAVKDLVDEGRSVTIRPKGDSMLPFIRSDRDSVTLERVTGRLSVGDIVLFRYNGKYVLHRIYSIREDGITLMGDGNLSGQEHCSESDVIGIVTAITKESGRKVKPGRARLWMALKPLRRWLLAIYRRI
ncbi:MAG: S24/S26 family peptidase [Bacteroidales bacterium]|nr:S24/S26 family peptidase [Bacteroidales bacterium]